MKPEIIRQYRYDLRRRINKCPQFNDETKIILCDKLGPSVTKSTYLSIRDIVNMAEKKVKSLAKT